MNSEKVKEIKELLRCMNGEKACTDCYINEVAEEQETCCINVVADMTLDLINELESENERLIKIKENCLEIIKQGEQQIINIAKETLKEFREKYKEALKEAVKGENVDCFVESLKIFDKTIEEKICDLK